MERKVIAKSAGIAGLIGVAFLAGSLLLGGGSPRSAVSGVAPEPTPEPTRQPIATLTPEGGETKGTLTPVDGSAADVEDANGGGTAGGTQAGGTGLPEATGEEPEPVITPTLPPGPPTPEPPDPEEPAPDSVVQIPSVVQTLPAADATGVARNTKIEVTFSQAMDTASVEAAFSINPGVSGVFSWDPEGVTMTFTPDADFEYGTLVEWQAASSAQDQSGVDMAADYAASFRVLRQKTISLYSQPGNDGHVYAPAVAALDKVVTEGGSHNALKAGSWMRGFLSFDLGKLPEDTVAITAAELHIHQRDHHPQAYSEETGALWVVRLPYGDLDVGDYLTPTPVICPDLCFPEGLELSTSPADGWKSVDLTLLVNKDWKASKGDLQALAPAGAEKLAQFRLQFLEENQGDGPDVWAEFHSGEAGGSAPKLLVTFVYP
jgi:Big-like domain-containing protein